MRACHGLERGTAKVQMFTRVRFLPRTMHTFHRDSQTYFKCSTGMPMWIEWRYSCNANAKLKHKNWRTPAERSDLLKRGLLGRAKMFHSSCFQLQVIGQGAVARSNLPLSLTLSKRCSFSSFTVASSQCRPFNHNAGACNRRWRLDNRQCPSSLYSSSELSGKESFWANKEIQRADRSLTHFKLHRSIFTRASLEEKQGVPETDQPPNPSSDVLDENNGAANDAAYPSGEYEFKKIEGWRSFVVKLKMLIAFPWERVKKGSVLNMKLRGQISDQLQGRFSSRLSLPKICENFIKAAHDPRIVGIYLQIEPLDCGWGKIDEIRRHILDYKKSGKFIVGYIPVCGEKEYYLACACGELFAPPGAYITLYGLKIQATFLGGVFEKVGIQPQIQRIGKYKSTGDLLSRKDMSKENCEMLTALLDNIYENWVQKISSAQGKTKEDIENLLNEGIYKVEMLKQEGWITDIKYDDEVIAMLKERLGQKQDKDIQLADYKKYSRVRKWTLGLSGGRDRIAVIRASGSISRVQGRFSTSRSGIVGEQFIEKIRQVRVSKKYKAVILRIDSPGGDALASDLMWREIRLLAASKPVIASMADVAASGGYYMAMGAGVIVAENLTLTGSIGVVTGKFSLNKLYERIGLNKEIISRGRFAELDIEQRPFRPDEEELFAKSAQNAYAQFRDKAAFSRSMSVETMETVAQGRVWSGKAAASLGLVDAIGGLSRAIAIAKEKAGIPQDSKVSVVELSKSSPSFSDIIAGGARALIPSFLGTDGGFKELVDELSPSGVQARMEDILFQGLGEHPYAQVLFKLIKDWIG